MSVQFRFKKSLLSISVALPLFALALSGCAKENAAKGTRGAGEKVVLNEVAHSIFYAPMYVALEEGYFKDAGIDLEIVTGFGADKTMTAVKNFAQLTQRAGNFLIAREIVEDFKWADIKGANVLGGRAGGMPEMVFEFVLKKNNIDPANDLNIDQSIDFGSTAAAFSGGQGDYTVEFEPSATALEAEGAGYVVASVGVDSGYVPYTAFSAKESYLIAHPDIIQAFTNALQKGMQFVSSHSSEEIAKSIAPQFAETDKKTIATIVSRYKEQDTWKNDVIFTEDAYTLLLDILDDAGQLDKRPEYENLVNTKFAQQAAQSADGK